MGSPRRFATAMVAAAAVGAATIGVAAAVADQDDAPSAVSEADAGLLERLGELEAGLPDPYAPLSELDIDEEDEWDVYADVFTNFKGALAPVEDDLRRLYIDADDAANPNSEAGQAAAAIAEIASGWLDLMNSAESFAVVTSHDLAFPIASYDGDGVATGADHLRGLAETAVVLLDSGAQKHLRGYTTLRDLSVAEGQLQALVDTRAADLERYAEYDQPFFAHILSQPSTVVLVPLDRFDTKGPGIESRASSLSYVCVDRDLFEAEQRPLTDEVLIELEAATPDRWDCGRFGILSEWLDED